MHVVQDLSPVLPEPLVQEMSQLELRKVILQCISDLARRVGDSLHLLEALGGIVGKLVGPGPLTTAVLECIAAAALAINFFPAKVCVLGLVHFRDITASRSHDCMVNNRSTSNRLELLSPSSQSTSAAQLIAPVFTALTTSHGMSQDSVLMSVLVHGKSDVAALTFQPQHCSSAPVGSVKSCNKL